MSTAAKEKIALVIDSLNGGGAERMCLLLAEHFFTLGYEVHLIALSSKRDYDIPNFVKYFSVGNTKTSLFQKISKTLHITTYRANIVASYLESQGEFKQIIVHLYEAYRCMALTHFPNTWYVLHNAIEASLQREKKLGPIKYWRAKKSYLVLNNKNIVCVSKGIEKEIQSLPWLTPAQLKTIYNPIDAESIISNSHIENQDIPNTKFIVHVGRFAKQKRHDILFSALSMLPKEYSLVLLCKPSEKLRRMIAEFQIEGRVIIAGWQPNPFNWIKNSECLALTSDYEGFGLVLAEALTLEIPVVSTDCPFGPNEILEGELSEFLVPCGESKKLANTILHAIESKEKFKNAKVLSKLSAEHVAKEYLALIS